MNDAGTKRKTGDAPRETAEHIAFDDNRLIAELAGAHDRHLTLLEQALGVRIDPRGNRFAITGDPANRARAAAALSQLYQTLARGGDVGVEDVRAAAAFSLDAAPNGPPLAVARADDALSLKTPKRSIAPRNQAQAAYLRALARGDLVFGVGPAGTGKTYLAVAHAVCLYQARRVDRLILSRPAVEAGERIGFLPGDLKDKVDPYLRPLYDALHDMLPADFVERRIANGDIEIAPLGFMRGRTFSRAAVILDEAQNATVAQTKMFLTRLGEGAHMALTGDPSQSDLPARETSGLADALALLEGVPGVEVATFDAGDVVRHPLVARIIERYDARDRRMGIGTGRGEAE
ncbi:MAG: PhoH family protein [Parvularculaceae bacterium]